MRHGADFSAQAVAAGAAAVLTDASGRDRAVAAGLPLPRPRRRGPARGARDVAAWVFGNPSERLLLVGITGTNGKTTTAYLVDAGLRAAGHRTGLLGTVQTRVGDEVTDSARTTPEAPDIQALLALMVERGCTAAVLEVSSHALALGRVDGVVLDVAVFTNLSQDHLDFHRTIGGVLRREGAAVLAAVRPRRGVVDVDDAYGRELVAISGVPTRTCSTHGAGPDARAADWRAVDVHVGGAGSTFALHGPGGERVDVRLQLPGEFNVANATVRARCTGHRGRAARRRRARHRRAGRRPGRMEPVDVGQPYLALVDYAHTPDAVTTLLDAVRALAGDGRVVVVLGCGGDRDPYKRPLMGAAAVLGADLAVLTSTTTRARRTRGAILAAMVAGAADAVGPPGAHAPATWSRPTGPGRSRSPSRPRGPATRWWWRGRGTRPAKRSATSCCPFDDRVVLREAIEHAAVAP